MKKTTIDELRNTATRRILEVLTGMKDPIGPNGEPSEALRQRIAEVAARAAETARLRVHSELAKAEAEIARERAS